MARLKSVTSGVTVSVDDALVERLGSEWEPVDEKSTTPARSRAKKSDDDK